MSVQQVTRGWVNILSLNQGQFCLQGSRKANTCTLTSQGRHCTVPSLGRDLCFHQIGQLGRFGLVVAMSVRLFVVCCCPLPLRFSQGSKGGPRGAKLSPTVASVPLKNVHKKIYIKKCRSSRLAVSPLQPPSPPWGVGRWGECVCVCGGGWWQRVGATPAMRSKNVHRQCSCLRDKFLV